MAIDAAGRERFEPSSREIGMRLMMSTLIFFLMMADIFNWQLSLGPGLSAKNAILYLLAVGLLAKFAVQHNFQLQSPIPLFFAVLIGYAIITMVAAAVVIEYSRYSLVESAIKLKSLHIDRVIFFLVFFYGLAYSRNAASMMKTLLVVVVFGNTMAVLDTLGAIQIGESGGRDDDRMAGVMGEPNQYGAFLVFFLPSLAAAAFTTKGVMRVLWLLGIFVSSCALLMTVSRGAFLSLLAGSLCGAVMFRRYISSRQIIAVGGAVIALITIAIGALSARYGALLYERVFEQSASGMEGLTSGRSDAWSIILARMAETPLTLLTGFGWDVYDTMPFRHSAHNYYLSLWFELGLIGLAAGTLLLVQVVRSARGAVDWVGPPYRSLLMASVVGTLGISIATFFVELYTPWLWFWAYAGLALRVAANATKPASEPEPKQAPLAEQPADLYGWSAASRPEKSLPR